MGNNFLALMIPAITRYIHLGKHFISPLVNKSLEKPSFQLEFASILVQVCFALWALHTI